MFIGIWAYLQIEKEPFTQTPVIETHAITLLQSPRDLPELQMVNKQGELAGKETFYGKWSLVFMGFTSCGHICPTKMAEMRMIQDQLNVPLSVVFVSVDPERDTPAVIKQYVDSFDPNFSGMTGSAETIEVFASALGAPYFVDPDPELYIVDHSSALFLIGPDASLVGTITPPLDINIIVDDLHQLL
ncbi:MAG: SCO family protein [Gammaproteobacteria bacterium]|nr:SCO family protein [Gammaproteobacteria bacterium]